MKAAIVGIAEHGLEGAGTRSELQLQAEAGAIALEDAGLVAADVDAIFTASNDMSWIPSVLVAEYLGIAAKYSDSTNIGGSSFEAHIGHATAAIAAGLCEIALITYGSNQRSRRSRALGASGPVRLTQQFEAPYGLPLPIGAYALAARRHMHLYGTTQEQLAQVAVSTREWAALNPSAKMQDPLSIEDVLASPMIVDPLHLLDCCLVTDGAGAVVVTKEGVARNLRREPVWVLGHGTAHTHATISNMTHLTQPSARDSGARAFGMAGLRPDEMDVVELYDSFTITPILTLEMLGFCLPGEGGPFIVDRGTGPTGTFPMNTNGGGLSFGHPGMFGIFLLIEAVRQLRGDAGRRQVTGARHAVAHGVGGALSSSATVILGRG
ncbi:acetyl-CoA acetyltransferase [Jatrophihabitans telluris]|uniref:Acetyl-CoA acetyltransferase n=1 Tax=Jatrophihabitans telluris TaxID=2038343 RepID=A0ABY4QZK3_9ACTN|nr:acetyl-CoA acetyltransferase [Jatrophihabitans telluris]UQX88985.1 acetyl-CoA acetyltransferase [Jatrophihabitans telluris]